MKKLTLIVLTYFFMTSSAFSAEESVTSVDFKIDTQVLESYTDKNPFKSKLPEKPQEVKVDNESNPIPLVSTLAQPPTPIEPPKPPTMSITGIVWNTDRPQAIINGQVVNQGDTIDGAQIVSIKKTGIDVIFEDVNFTIKP